MANASGTATSPVDLLQNKIVPFLTGNGWTLNLGAVDGSGYRAHLQRGSMYINFRAVMNEANFVGTSSGYGIVCYVSTGFNSGSNWYSQPGASVNSTPATWGAAMVLPSGSIVQYDIFQDSSYNVWVIVEKTASAFGYLGFGYVTPIVSFTGGAFVCGSNAASYLYPGNSNNNIGFLQTAYCPFFQGDSYGGPVNSAFVRADVDSITGGWVGVGPGASGNSGKMSVIGASEIAGSSAPVTSIPYMDSTLFARLTGNLASVPVLMPIRVWTTRDAGGYSPLGIVPDVYFSNATSQGYSIRQEITIGGNTYKFYPNFAILKV